MTTSNSFRFLRAAAALALTAWVGLMAAGQVQAQSPGQAGQKPAAQKPFETTYRRPTVSPYLQLQQQGMNPLQNQNIYQTMVQPQLQQQQQQIQMLQQQRQLSRVQGQVQQIQQSSQARQFDETIRPTGHASTYMNYSHYYPQR